MFEFNNASLPAGANNDLDKFVKILKGNSNTKVEINGHCDDQGEADYNQNLSVRRANSVASYFKNKGIGADRMVVKGHGETKPIAPNNSLAGYAKNRRTEVKIR